MPSSYSNNLRVEMQAAGENLNTWGAPKLNLALQDLIDALTKRVAFALSGTKTLTTNNASADEARCMFLDVTSGTGGTVTIPGVEKLYAVRNGGSGDVIVTTGAGVTATIKPSEISFVVCDASNVRRFQQTDFGSSRLTSIADPVNPQDGATRAYVDAQAWVVASGNLPAQSGANGRFLQTDGSVPSWVVPDVSEISGAAPLAAPSFTGGATIAGGLAVSSGGLTYTGSTKANVQALGAVDFDLSAADFFTKSISGATTFTFSNATASKAQAFIVELTISGAAVPSWPASVKWGGGVNPSSALGNGRHVIGFVTFDGGTTWTGMLGSVAAA